ncbi:MAG: PKD domain-containing protein [Bacteroidota bacterium]
MNRVQFKLLLSVLLCCQLISLPLFGQLPDDFYDTPVVDGFELPLGITFDENGQGYIWEKAGQVYVLDTLGELQTDPLIDISEEVSSWKDHGLNGFCLDNNFTTNGYFYLYYVVDLHHYWNYGTAAYSPDSTVTFKPTFARVVRYQADANTGFTSVEPASRKILLGESIDTGVPILYEFHGAGTILQGTDGTLLLSSGETTGGLQIGIGNEPDDEFVPQAIDWGIISPDQDLGAYKSQYLGSLNGKVLRIDPETGDGPASNPFYDSAAPRSPQSRTWGWGLRNPYRMVLRPNTGSHYPEDGDPGTLIVGDVGNGAWEELNVLHTGGQNFGWPVFEGIPLAWKFWTQEVPDNPLAPNPLNTCDQPFFNFRDLLAQPKESGPYLPGNPCDASQPIPAEAFPSYAQTPMLVWSNSRWNEPTRAAVPGWNENGDPKSLLLGTADAPVEGEAFDGYSSLAGVFYQGEQFPEDFHGKYIHFDFSGWIRTLDIDENNTLDKVELFHEYTPDIIHLVENVKEGALYYTNLAGEVRKISFGGNPAPVAIIEADRFYGVGPLEVQFTGGSSFDPNSTALTYSWDFGDGGNSTEQAPTHTFTASGSGPTSYEVRLTVTDAEGAQNTASRIVSLNNSPPDVVISSFKDGDQYPLDFTSLLRLAAEVSDAEHGPEELMYQWRTFLHHNDHFHPDPVIFEPESHFLISPLGCGEEIYFYRIELTVTDPEGLATTVSQRIYPYCGTPFTDWLELSGENKDAAIELNWGTIFEQDITSMELQRGGDYFSFEPIAQINTSGNHSEAQNYQFRDESPLLGANIYRVKATTSDGAFTYSNLLALSYPPPKAWSVFPNPASEQLNFSLEEATSGLIEVELFNIAGQQIRRISFPAVIGETWEQQLLLGSWPKGVYSYRIISGEQSYTGQIVLQ